MANPITYGDLDQFLREAGFAVERRDAEAVVFALPKTDVFFAFPPREPDQPVDPFHLWSVRKMLVERGVVEEDAFEWWECRVRFGEESDEFIEAVSAGNGARRRR